MVRVERIIAEADKLWPPHGADDWDRPGLICGSRYAEVKSALLSVDLTLDVIDEAVTGGFDMIISHHPFLLRPALELTEHSAKGSVLARAIRASIALFSAHTNADIVEEGVSAVLAAHLGLVDSKPLVANANQTVGHGRIGKLPQSQSLLEFSRTVASLLPPTASGVRIAGEPGQLVNSVALCAGAGDSFIEAALNQSADVYLTSDLRHHPTQEALEKAKASDQSFALIDISHWAAESLWLDIASKQLSSALSDVKFVVSEIRTDPWDFAVTQ